MTADAAPGGIRPLEGKPGRKAFKGLAPKGYRIRMMEPGEARSLLAISRAGDALLIAAGRTELEAIPPVALGDFVRFLLAHEVFVAVEKRTGEPVGFAAARDRVDLYWLSEMAVHPDHGRKGIGAALLHAVTERARWFFHRALGLTTYVDIAFNRPFYEHHGFMTVPRKDVHGMLEERLVDETPPGAAVEDRVLMVKWL